MAEITSATLDQTSGTIESLAPDVLAQINGEAAGPLPTAAAVDPVIAAMMAQLQELAKTNAALVADNQAIKNTFRIELEKQKTAVVQQFYEHQIGFARDQIRPSENPDDDYQFMIEELKDGRTCVWIPNFINPVPEVRVTKMPRIKMNNGAPVLDATGKPVKEIVEYQNFDVARTNIRATLKTIMVQDPTTKKLRECTFTAFSNIQAKFNATAEENTNKADKADSAAHIETGGTTDETPTARNGANNEGQAFQPSNANEASDIATRLNRPTQHDAAAASRRAMPDMSAMPD